MSIRYSLLLQLYGFVSFYTQLRLTLFIYSSSPLLFDKLLIPRDSWVERSFKFATTDRTFLAFTTSWRLCLNLLNLFVVKSAIAHIRSNQWHRTDLAWHNDRCRNNIRIHQGLAFCPLCMNCYMMNIFVSISTYWALRIKYSSSWEPHLWTITGDVYYVTCTCTFGFGFQDWKIHTIHYGL